MCGIQGSPCVDYGDNLLMGKVGEGEIVGWSECNNIAFAGHGLRAKEE